MTTQEAFDRVWGWFVLDRHQQGRTAEGCFVYYDPLTRNRCAVGCLLDDDRLDQLIRQGRNSEGYRFALRLSELNGVDRAFLMALMRAHDMLGGHPSFSGAFEQDLRRLAADYGLTVPTESSLLLPV